jgi:hypothetical protein
MNSQSSAIKTTGNLKPQRASNFELLRIVAIIMIVAGHMWVGRIWDNSQASKIISVGVFPFFAVAVDCFVLISGWFSIRFSMKKLFSLNNMTTFWVLVLCILALCLGLHRFDFGSDWKLLFPVFTNRYWFIAVYMVLCLLSPYLNLLVENISAKELRRLICIFLVWYVLQPTLAYLLDFSSISASHGYDIVNFVMLYLIGRYLRLYYRANLNRFIYLGVYLVTSFVNGLLQLAFTSAENAQCFRFTYYDFLLILISSLGLFLFFSQLQITSKIVNRAALCCLAVYVIHFHPWTYNWFFNSLLAKNSVQGWSFLIFIICVPIATFLVCWALEELRRILFNRVNRLSLQMKNQVVKTKNSRS